MALSSFRMDSHSASLNNQVDLRIVFMPGAGQNRFSMLFVNVHVTLMGVRGAGSRCLSLSRL